MQPAGGRNGGPKAQIWTDERAKTDEGLTGRHRRPLQIAFTTFLYLGILLTGKAWGFFYIRVFINTLALFLVVIISKTYLKNQYQTKLKL